MKRYLFFLFALLILTSGCAQSKPEETPAESPSSVAEQPAPAEEAPPEETVSMEESEEEALPAEEAEKPVNAESERGTLTLPALPEDAAVQELGGSSLPLFTLPDDLSLVVPALTAWQYTAAEPDTAALEQQAEDAASRLWGSYTVTETGVALEAEDTEYGLYQESLQITAEGELWYQAKYLSQEETPFLSKEKGSREEAVAVARSLAEALDLGAMTEDEPEVEEDAESAHYVVFWPQVVDGLPVYHHGVKARVIGDTVVTLQSSPLALEAVERTTPDFFLTAEEALYCVNYARGLAEGDSVLLRDLSLASCELCLDVQFTYPDYAPVYLFHLLPAGGGTEGGLTVRVDAFTGASDTGTNEGGAPSPYAS